MQLFYNPNLSPTTSEFSFDKEESKHIVKVLRKKTGDILHVTNGLGDLFEVEILLESDTKCIVKINSVTTSPPPQYELHLAVAPTKMTDRYEWFLEKATEIGVSSITPIICEHSERKVLKTERFDKIIQAAMKQSLSLFLPKLNSPISFNEFIKNNAIKNCFIAHCDDLHKQSLKSLLTPKTQLLILIGPEGDFSKQEIELALQQNFKPVSLGTTRLRTETAAIVACHSVAFINE